jgi:DNA-binding MarR family transcriptional regulator
MSNYNEREKSAPFEMTGKREPYTEGVVQMKELILKRSSGEVRTEGIIGLISTIRDKANKLILKELRACNVNDIVPAHGGVLVQLFIKPERTMGEIAKGIDRTKSTVSVLVDRLVGLGYLETEKDSGDSRVTKVRLTKKGKSLEKTFWEVSENMVSRVYKGFSEQEKRELIRLLTRVGRNL